MHGYARLDGSMSQPARTASLATFADDPRVRVLLLSLRAGGVGLNLTAAQVMCMACSSMPPMHVCPCASG